MLLIQPPGLLTLKNKKYHKKLPGGKKAQAAARPTAFERTAPFLCAGLFFFILLKNAWLCDDIWIALRQIEQLFAGNGLRWNPHERIQLSTTVIGFFLTAFLRLFTTDYFINYAIQALFFNTLILVLLARLLMTAKQWCTAVLLLAASNAYMDFSWSGLYNFVGHAMLVGFLLLWFPLWKHDKEKAPSAAPANLWLGMFALAGLAPLFRPDFPPLLWIPCAWAWWSFRGRMTRLQLLNALLLLFLPFLLWSLFSLVYFGLPLPLTAYVKLAAGLSSATYFINGLAYYRYMLENDLPTLLIIFTALGWLFWRGSSADRALAAALSFNLLYILLRGADYMGGRFFTYSYLLSVVIVVSRWEAISAMLPGKSNSPGRRQGLVFFAVAWSLLLPHTPLKSPFLYSNEGKQTNDHYITDERSLYHRASRIAAYIDWRRGAAEYYPDNIQVRMGHIISRSRLPVIHLCNMGMTPFNARLDQKLIDIYGFSDLLQIFQPALNKRPGHFLRYLPKGYLESVAADQALLADQRYNEFYKKLRLLSQSEELFSKERLAAILAVNFGDWPAPPAWPNNPGGRLPLTCYAKHDPEVLHHLEENIESIEFAEMNHSGLSAPL